jgi:hypothetical protein
MNAIQLHPVVEMRRFIRGCLRAVRSMRDVDPELMFDGAKQIADEIATERVEREQRLSQQITRAQAPDSPGGRNITPAEIAPVVAESGATVQLLSETQAVAKVV